ncbi:MAG: FtsX-like permease family protein [Nitrospirae bacterium]|nr:FtsX-like permease family protein [Nitrospirota bacterium]
MTETTAKKGLHPHWNLLRFAVDQILRHRLRSAVVAAALVAILTPFLTAMAISEGVRAESALAVHEGADFYVASDQFGKNAPIPLRYLEEFARIPGVERAVPRVVGRAYVNERLAVIVGLPPASIPPGAGSILKGRPLRDGARNEALIGAALARHGGLQVGHAFQIPIAEGKTFEVVGLFQPTVSIWGADLIYLSFADAAEVFGMEGQASEILLYIKPGYEEQVAFSLDLLQMVERGRIFLRTQNKDLVRQYLNRGFTLKAGIFTALYAVAFALAIPALLVVSGFGMSERRREIGVLKATGWHTEEVLEVVFWESLLHAAAGAALALLLAMAWIYAFNGALVAQFFIPEIGLLAPFPVPARFLPLPFLLGFLFSVALTLVGSLYTAWRAAAVPPVEAMR